jgi:hypothetical protein
MPSGAAAQAVAEVVEALRKLFISALSRPHQACHATAAVCSGVCRQRVVPRKATRQILAPVRCAA